MLWRQSSLVSHPVLSDGYLLECLYLSRIKSSDVNTDATTQTQCNKCNTNRLHHINIKVSE